MLSHPNVSKSISANGRLLLLSVVCASLAVVSCSKRDDQAESGTTDYPRSSQSEDSEVNEEAEQRQADPHAEFAALETLAPDQRGVAALEFYRDWGARDGASAVLHAERDGTALASGSLRAAFEGWLSDDEAGAKAWVGEIEVSRRLLKFASALGECLDGPKERAGWADKQSDAIVRRQLLSRSLVEWGRSEDPAAGIEWLQNHGGLEDQKIELGQLVRSWTDRDAEAASEALSTMQSGPGRDAAIAAMVTIIAPDQSTAALRWAETIDDAAKREEILALVAKIGGSGGGALPN